MRIGLLTGGGDCPGLNAAIRAVVRAAAEPPADTVIGFHHGWRGLAADEARQLDLAMTNGIQRVGGTILGTARFHPHEHEGGIDAVLATVKREELDAVIVIGGDGTLDAARYVSGAGVAVIGIPKTIDNDVMGTEHCIGFDSALAIATEAVDRLQTTAESHDRLMVVEVMGREAGWLALGAGVAGGADAICIPEEPIALDDLAAGLRRRHEAGANASVVVVAEGTRLLGDHDIGRENRDGVGRIICEALGERTGYEARFTALGHVQRGGTPTATDRLFAARLGVAAVREARSGARDLFMAVLGDEVVARPLTLLGNGPRLVPAAQRRVARCLTGC